MKVIYHTDDYDPTEDMNRMIHDVARNPFSPKIEYFVMDVSTVDRLRYYQMTKHGYGGLQLYGNGPSWTFAGIPIAVVSRAVANAEAEKFVTIVHGYEELKR